MHKFIFFPTKINRRWFEIKFRILELLFLINTNIAYADCKEDILFEVQNVNMELLLTATDLSLDRNIPLQFCFSEICRKLRHLHVGGC